SRPISRNTRKANSASWRKSTWRSSRRRRGPDSWLIRSRRWPQHTIGESAAGRGVETQQTCEPFNRSSTREQAVLEPHRFQLRSESPPQDQDLAKCRLFRGGLKRDYETASLPTRRLQDSARGAGCFPAAKSNPPVPRHQAGLAPRLRIFHRLSISA